MSDQVNVTQTGSGRLKVSVISSDVGIRVSRHEMLYPSASKKEIRDAIRRQRLEAARSIEAVREEER